MLPIHLVRSVFVVAALTGLLVVAVPAQLQPPAIGAICAPPELGGLTNCGARNSAELLGRAVLYIYVSTTNFACNKSVVRINRLHKKFKDDGLTVIVVTDEDDVTFRAWADEEELKVPYGFDRDHSMRRMLGFSSTPHCFVISPVGKVLFSKSIEEMGEEQIQNYMLGCLTKALWEMPAEYDKFRAALAAGDLAAAVVESAALAKTVKDPGDAKTLTTAVQNIIDGLVNEASRRAAKGDWLGARGCYERLDKACANTPIGKAAHAKLVEIGNSDIAKKGIKQQKELETIMAMPRNAPEEKEARTKALQEFVKANAGGYAATRATEELAANAKKK